MLLLSSLFPCKPLLLPSSFSSHYCKNSFMLHRYKLASGDANTSDIQWVSKCLDPLKRLIHPFLLSVVLAPIQNYFSLPSVEPPRSSSSVAELEGLHMLITNKGRRDPHHRPETLSNNNWHKATQDPGVRPELASPPSSSASRASVLLSTTHWAHVSSGKRQK